MIGRMCAAATLMVLAGCTMGPPPPTYNPNFGADLARTLTAQGEQRRARSSEARLIVGKKYSAYLDCIKKQLPKYAMTPEPADSAALAAMAGCSGQFREFETAVYRWSAIYDVASAHLESQAISLKYKADTQELAAKLIADLRQDVRRSRPSPPPSPERGSRQFNI
jgi:hypothetical protein